MTHDDQFVDPELIIREEDWVNHEKDEGNFDPKLVAVEEHEEVRKFEKLKVYKIVKEEEFKPKAIKIGTKWVGTNKGTETRPMIKARLVEKEFADDTKKRELFAGTPGLPALRYLVSKVATKTCGEERKFVAVMDVNSAFLYGRARRPIFIEKEPFWMECWQNWWDHCTEHMMLH